MDLQEKKTEGQYKLSDLIDIQSLQLLMDSFYAASEIPCGIIDSDGNILVAVGWQDICTRFHRINPITQKRCLESDTICTVKLQKMNDEKYIEYKCRNGLMDVAFPIIVEGNYLANLFIGQFFYEKPDTELFLKQAEEVGFDVDSYMAALDKVPIWTTEKVDSIMDYYNKLATMLTNMGLENLKRKRAEKELKEHSRDLKFKNKKLMDQIAEKEQAVVALQESEEKFRSIFQYSTAGMAIFSSEGSILQVNPALCEFLGYPENELLQLNALDPIYPEDRKEISSYFEQLVDGEKEYFHFGKRFVRKDGSIVCGYASAVLLQSTGNNYVMGLVQDITDRKKAEEKLRASEEKYSTLVEKGDDGIIIVQDGIVSFANHKMAELVGQNKSDVIGSSIFDYIPDEYREMVLERFGIQIKNSKRIPIKYELEMLSHYGLKVPVEVNASIIDHSGNPAIMAIIRDITERKVVEEKLKNYAEELSLANEELKSLDRIKDDLLSNVSHELKTPLVSIKGYTELLNDEILGDLNQSQKKATEVIARNSKRLSNLIDSILYISMTQAGKAKYIFKPVQISDVVDSVISDMYPQIKEKELTIKKNVPQDLPAIYADEDYIVRLLINLISNAIKFTPSGGDIIIGAISKENELHLSVEDTGIGIPENLIPNLFQRFYQIDATTTRKYNGTGLGLHICKNIVEAHNGKIWVESEEGKGTKFHITMPFNDV